MRKVRPRRTQQKVAPSLKGFANAKKAKIDLLRDVQTHVVAENARSGNDHRSKDKIHVSEITKGACPRMLFYKVSGEDATDAEPGAWHQLVAIWSAGSAEHEKWQRWLKEMGDLWGTWTCLSCEHSWDDTSPATCESCGSGLLRYDEVNLHADDLSLVGHADGAVPRLNALVEIKSFSTGSVRVENASLVNEHTHKIEGKTVIDHDGLWKAVKRPLRSHLVQGLFYLYMCKEMGLPYDRIIFIYESKTTQATKTFEVTLSNRHLAPYLEVLTSVNEAVKTGDTPARPALYSKDAKPCTACPFRTKCWESSDQDSEESTPVQAGGPGSRSEESRGEPEVLATPEAGEPDPGGSRRRNRSPRPRPGRDDDGLHQVGRAPRRATRDGGGGRAVGGARDGTGEGPRFARRNRQGRDQD